MYELFNQLFLIFDGNFGQTRFIFANKDKFNLILCINFLQKGQQGTKKPNLTKTADAGKKLENH